MRQRLGFESAPAGQLLDQTIDLESEMGIAHERSIGFAKDFHVHDRDLLVFPRGACRMRVRTRSPDHDFTITSAHCLYIPRGVEHSDLSQSAVYDTVALLPSPRYMEQLVTENGLEIKDARFLQKNCVKFKRSRWLDDLIERYFFERILNPGSPKGCVFFLEKQMLNEFARLVFVDKLDFHGDLLGQEPDDVLSRSLRFIEAHLFEEVDVEKICKETNTSQSTLLRTFKKLLSTSPGAYIRDRRMDEAAKLIERGDYQISDICMLVGYDDLSAFTRAFRTRFGVAPGAYRETADSGVHRKPRR